MTGTTDPAVNFHPDPRPQAPATAPDPMARPAPVVPTDLRQPLASNLPRPVTGVADGD